MNRGKVLTTKPLGEEVIAKIKAHLASDLKHLSLFTVAVNSAFRSTDLLRLKRDEVDDDGKRITLLKRERKTKKVRRVLLGPKVSTTLRRWIKQEDPKLYIWTGLRGPHTHGWWGGMLKKWCREVGAPADRVAGHSCRKAFVRIQHTKYKASLTTLQWMLNHQTPAQTLMYMGLLPEDADQTYLNEV